MPINRIMFDGPDEAPIFALRMTNAELESAILFAHERAGDGNDLERLWMNHLTKLLEIQVIRASYAHVKT